MSKGPPLLVLEVIHLRPTLEHPRPTSGILEHGFRSFIVVLFHLHQLIRTHAQELLPNVVEAIEPQLSSMIAGIDR